MEIIREYKKGVWNYRNLQESKGVRGNQGSLKIFKGVHQNPKGLTRNILNNLKLITINIINLIIILTILL